jgi:hypothetical protein
MQSNKLKLTAATLSTLFLVTGCNERLEVNPPPPPAKYLTCQELPAVPAIAPLTPIRTANGTTVYLTAETDARDAQIARWIVDVRGAWFDCSNQLGRVRTYVENAE